MASAPKPPFTLFDYGLVFIGLPWIVFESYKGMRDPWKDVIHRASLPYNSVSHPTNFILFQTLGDEQLLHMAEARPSRAELEARFKESFWDDGDAQNIVKYISIEGLPIGYKPLRVNQFVELGNRDVLSGKWVPMLDSKNRIKTMLITPEIYLEWKNTLLKQLALRFGDYHQFLDMRKKETFFVHKAVKGVFI